MNVAVINVLAIVLALAVTSKLKLRNVYRMGFFVPYLIGGLILGYLWQFIFNNAVPAIGEATGFCLRWPRRKTSSSAESPPRSPPSLS